MAAAAFSDLFFYSLQRITMGGTGSSEASAMKQAAGLSVSLESLFTPNALLCAALLLYSVVMVAMNAVWRNRLLFSILVSFIYNVLLPSSKKIASFVRDDFFGSKAPSAVASFLSDDRRILLVLSLFPALLVVIFRGVLRYVPILALLLFLYNTIRHAYPIDTYVLATIFIAAAVISVVFCSGIFVLAENFTITVICCFSGALLFFSLVSYITGHPKSFLDTPLPPAGFLLWLGCSAVCVLFHLYAKSPRKY
ncbi:hypothetical protein PAPHI01_0331 [Pancytospora philotis]|nr:hypothetical protein PAPHI01_0331 [Pancytospora philotis]